MKGDSISFSRKSSSENNLSQSESRSLFSIGEDLERLNEILDEAGDDTQQQELLNEWLQQLGTERSQVGWIRGFDLGNTSAC